MPAWLSEFWPLPMDFFLVKRLWISWFPRLRCCGRYRNLEFAITITITRQFAQRPSSVTLSRINFAIYLQLSSAIEWTTSWLRKLTSERPWWYLASGVSVTNCWSFAGTLVYYSDVAEFTHLWLIINLMLKHGESGEALVVVFKG